MAFLANGPGRIPGGRVGAMADFSDVLPTLCDLAGAPRPSGVTLDGRSLFGELLSSRPGELVDPGSAIVLRATPFRFDPAAAFQAVQRGIERALRDSEGRFGDLVQSLRNGPAVHGLEGQGLEDQEIESPLGQVELAAHGFPFRFYKRVPLVL